MLGRELGEGVEEPARRFDRLRGLSRDEAAFEGPAEDGEDADGLSETVAEEHRLELDRMLVAMRQLPVPRGVADLRGQPIAIPIAVRASGSVQSGFNEVA